LLFATVVLVAGAAAPADAVPITFTDTYSYA
jgi:hypothetical protein